MSIVVHSNREYGSDEIRHFSHRGYLHASGSGQFCQANIKVLIKEIQRVAKEARFDPEKIYFLDVRDETHFELNGRAVTWKEDDNKGKVPAAIVEREKELASSLLQKVVTFKEKQGAEKTETVESGTTVREFIEKDFKDSAEYIRFPLLRHGPLTDSQVDEFMEILEKVEGKKGWLHINSLVGIGQAVQLLVLEDMLHSAKEQSFETIAARFQEKEIKESDPDAGQKQERLEFLKRFYNYAKFRHEHRLTWGEFILLQT